MLQKLCTAMKIIKQLFRNSVIYSYKTFIKSLKVYNYKIHDFISSQISVADQF